MEHVTIISQEAITRGLLWPTVILGVIAILIMIVFNIVGRIKRNLDICIRGDLIAFALYPVMLSCMLVCNTFFPVETGRYKYEGTLDPDMTIVEFEEFQQQYSNIRFEDGVWKWEDKE